MTIASKGAGGSVNSLTANQASLALVTTTTAGAAGDFALLMIATDNFQTTDGDEGAVTSVTSTGNTWTKAIEFCNGQGAAQAGATCSMWYCNLAASIAIGSTITINFSNATARDATAATLHFFTKAAGQSLALEGTPAGLANDAAAAGSLNVTTANIACLRVRAIASESSTATVLTKTAAFTAVFVQNLTTGGATAVNMAIRGEYLISTATGAASAPTGGAGAVDNASVYAAFKEVPPATGTGALAAQSATVVGPGLSSSVGSGSLGLVELGEGPAPTIDLNFQAGGDFSASLTCVRSTTNYAQTLAGALVSFAPDTLRVTDKGLLREPGATNFIPYSANFTNSWWTKQNLTVTANSATAPDGTSTASTFTDSAVNNLHRAYDASGVTTTEAGSTVFSVYVKNGTHNGWIRLYGPGVSANFNVATGVVGQSSSGAYPHIEPLANGWYRCSVVYGAAAGAYGPQIAMASGDGDPAVSPTYLGTGATIFVWGAQSETGDTPYGFWPTSYIATSGANGTRPNEEVHIVGAANTLLLSGVGSFVVDFKTLHSSFNYAGIIGEQNGFWFWTGPSADSTVLFQWLEATNTNVHMQDGAKAAVAFITSPPRRTSAYAGVVSATESLYDTSLTQPWLGSNSMACYYRRLALWPTEQTAENLRILTSPPPVLGPGLVSIVAAVGSSEWSGIGALTAGVAALAATGTVVTPPRSLTASAGSYTITGTAAILKRGHVPLLAAAGSYTITGTAAILKRTRLPLLAAAGSYTITGTAVVLRRARTMPASAGAYSILGTTATLARGRPPMTAGAGSYTITGTAAVLRRARVLAISTGAYLLTGIDAVLRRARVPLAIGTGAYTITGTAATFRRTRTVAIGTGAYTITGTAATLRPARVLAVGTGAYLLTGTDAVLRRARVPLAVGTGAYTITGTAATLRRTRTVAIGSGAYAITGTAVAFSAGAVRALLATAGAYAITGTAAILARTRLPLLAAAGSYTITGTAAVLRLARVLAISTGAYAITGTAAVLRAARVPLAIGTGAYTITGTAATLRRARGLAVGTGAYTITGTAAILARTRLLQTTAGSYTITGTAAVLRLARVLAVGTGAYLLTGTDAVLRRARVPLAIGTGAYLLTGTAATLRRARVLAVGTGAYVLTGTAAVLRAARTVAAGTGAYLLTGTAATFRRTRTVAVGSGAYTITGTAVAFSAGAARTLLAAAGSYTITGTALILKRTRLPLLAASGSYTITGTAAVLRRARVLAISTGAYLLTGTAATLRRGLRLFADTGAYLLTGTDAVLRRTRALAAGTGAYLLTGTAATLRAVRRLTINVGAYAITGTPVVLVRTTANRLVLAPGAYTITGTAAAARIVRRVLAAPGAYVITGTTAQFARGRRLALAAGAYVITGTAIALRPSRRLLAAAGAYVITGTAAVLRLAHRLAIGTGSYLVTGTAVAGRKGRTLAIAAGFYSITGSPVELTTIQTVPRRRPTSERVRSAVLSPTRPPQSKETRHGTATDNAPRRPANLG